jgi:cytochrome c oxidase subunit 1
MSTTAIDAHAGARPKGFGAWAARWITTTNHKDIGTLYLVFSLVMLFVGGGMAMVIRAELFEPGLQFVNPLRFNQMTTMHALIMVFGMIMPAFAGFANWMVPLMIGAPDMALPRLNNWSFWLLPFAATLLRRAGRCTRRSSCKRATRFRFSCSRSTCSASPRSWPRSTSSSRS